MNKIVFVACMLVVAVCSAEERPRTDETKKIIEDCKTETGATDDDMKTLILRQPMRTKNGWCLTACMKKKSGVMDASNKINMDKLKETTSVMKESNPELYKKFITLMEECKEKSESDPKNLADECTAAQTFGTCFYDKKKEAGIP